MCPCVVDRDGRRDGGDQRDNICEVSLMTVHIKRAVKATEEPHCCPVTSEAVAMTCPIKFLTALELHMDDVLPHGL